MTRPGAQPFHPSVKALLADFEAAQGGPRLSHANLEKWSRRLRAESRPVAVQLVILAKRFFEAGAAAATVQLVALVTLLLGEVMAQKMLEAAGVVSQQAEQLVKEAHGVSSPLAGGLAPGPRAATGVSLRGGPKPGK